MNRRNFLSQVATGSGIVLLGGGFWAHRAYARSLLQQELVRQASPVLTHKAHEELLSLPDRAREEMRRYFHGVCLNVHEFATRICSDDFAEQVRQCASPRDQQELVLLAFASTVVNETRVLDQVRLIAEDISHDLDRHWAACCDELADRWNFSLREYQSTVTAAALSQKMTPLLQTGLAQAMARARSTTQRPALVDGAEGVARSALLLLPVVLRGPGAGWPVFALVAFRSVLDYFLGLRGDRSAQVQLLVSEKLASLGNQMGTEFENEVRRRIAELHRWQDEAVAGAAGLQAQQLIHF